ncbi:DUF58 domain-containing protein [Luteibacter aegosomatissinici]|uniref:DUF58 domain-containing protein n=1 Tax=Luteibacter aegosomatissinici TaxID=2911539 RepID=UPI001FFA3554|nr:DUF58 domain-containing protein [Luteibacter aegosomatissinici]UPG95063.1 DUF58 domain-containing protein [Luteibacter aegosomatissinici]
MSAVPHVADPRVNVALPELLALRSRVMRAAPPPVVSRAPRSGQRPGRLHGRGMDYAESRVYQAGDDVRRMDWRLTARSGVAHTKLFQEEREGRLLVLLDTNTSMRFGTRARFKSVQAARAAATAAWYAIRGGDRVGVLAFGGQQRLLRPQGGPRGALAVCGALAAWDAMPPGADESLSAALQRAGRLMHGASRVLLVSDGFAVDPPAYGRMLSLVNKAEVRILTVADPLEMAEPPAGRYPFAHDGVHYDIALHGERQRADFARALGEGRERLTALASQLGLLKRTIDTTADPLNAVIDLLGPQRAR